MAVPSYNTICLSHFVSTQCVVHIVDRLNGTDLLNPPFEVLFLPLAVCLVGLDD